MTNEPENVVRHQQKDLDHICRILFKKVKLSIEN